ncbi:solute carrier family 25 [Capsaspora owczarzaki ATCC 30864]|uniref:Solute carrier family 25 n=1 Tax=Capsaspora owczarzaki (strain ATCC 30864) TaxID=595528 RepID=A0A0D2VXC2_CAPO3|nr:solute carrier family 25 [Capsaspora owczarzaki ATCC 30864]KJE96287.1 solute carrier family 25 [Capsaspora owczarzaki ATCC 30864]|eukprot:XP_004344251.1 solute carrier family 25 [Capsaspora owczarzaki ATCC 30864]
MPAADATHLTLLTAGAFAGASVDLALFPLDTLKTRLQSQAGFVRSGGFRGVYAGVAPVAISSMPGSAVFWLVYENLSSTLKPLVGAQYAPVAQMAAASCGEVIACVVRVPSEVVKQRLQAGVHKNMVAAVRHILQTDGIAGFYRGYSSTILREVPFSFIQFPIYEAAKAWLQRGRDTQITPQEVALCGSFAGGIAAAVTTPLDVVKTRIMLSKDKKLRVINTFRSIIAEEGVGRLFSGITPRVGWISVGGCIYFGAYEFAKQQLSKHL